ncbi:dicarboxylate/amino acid:cation symporter [bacterium]|nr:dicarboxylate/amino acid:cation symporter [bacterium]
MAKLCSWKNLDLQWQILIGIGAGLILGIVLNQTAASGVSEGPIDVTKTVFQLGGEIFIRLLQMLIIPLVFASIFMSIVNLGNIRELKEIGLNTVVYYLATTALAVLVGIILVNLIHPGRGFDSATVSALKETMEVPEHVIREGVGQRSSILIILETFVHMIPTNPVKAMVNADILQVIFFTIFIAVVTALLGKSSEPFIRVIESLDRIMTRSIILIMKIAPYCIFFLVATLMTDLGFQAIIALGKYAMTVLIGLIIHACITLPLLVFLIGRYNPYRLFKAMLPAILTAWSTASSIATLPITLDCLEKKAGVHRKIGNFVLPLGATVNMDGTALYESVAVIFIAELLGFPLSLGTQMIIFITATLAAIGAAAIPGAGLVTMGIVLTAAGLPLEGIGLILAIDRILDQFRTAVNVWGDASGGIVIGRLDNSIESFSDV